MQISAEQIRWDSHRHRFAYRTSIVFISHTSSPPLGISCTYRIHLIPYIYLHFFHNRVLKRSDRSAARAHGIRTRIECHEFSVNVSTRRCVYACIRRSCILTFRTRFRSMICDLCTALRLHNYRLITNVKTLELLGAPTKP